MREAIKGWASVLVFVGIAAYIYWVGPWALWYAYKYHVPHDRVYIDPEPADCDFLHAPLGIKRCHYEKVVFAHLAEGSGIRTPFLFHGIKNRIE
jgi:hypothetical protein